MKADELKKKYIDFFVKKGHKKLANLSLVPEDDPTTLFISAGMQPLMPYLLGEPHPLGKRLVSLQRCLRTGDIEEVGNVFHNTFFEMLGNWSLGDYWKRESLSWSYEFLTKILGLNPKRFHVTVFKGDKNAPKDKESGEIWLSLGIPKERIYPLPKKDNWWETSGTGPGGPDSEIFYDIGKPACGPSCRPGDNCGRFFEMWNNVFMEYNRKPDGSYEKLKQKNVDTGMGVERTTAVLEGKEDIYQTELFAPVIKEIEKASGKKCEGENKKSMRIIADHLRAAAFVMIDGVRPSNVEQGYVLRRLIRRTKDQALSIKISGPFRSILEKIVEIYQKEYPQLAACKDSIFEIFEKEENKYNQAIKRGKKFLVKAEESLKIKESMTAKKSVTVKANIEKPISGKEAFKLYATYGLSPQQIRKQGYKFNQTEFDKAFKNHQKISRVGAQRKFTGGLADHSKEVIKLHTATHLLHQALRDVLGEHVRQVGSNITAERLRFDFTHPEKLTDEQIKKVEKIVNQKIKENLPVKMEVMTLAEAKKKGVLAFFSERYGEKVKIYLIGDYSKEVCGGPHVDFTKEIGGVKIIKEKPVGAGRRRIYAELAHGS